MNDRYPSLHQTVIVTSDRSWLGFNTDVPHGTVMRGQHVDLRATNRRNPDDFRIMGSPPMRARTERRYAGLSSVPAGVDMRITLPHDCENHLDGIADEETL